MFILSKEKVVMHLGDVNLKSDLLHCILIESIRVKGAIYKWMQHSSDFLLQKRKT